MRTKECSEKSRMLQEECEKLKNDLKLLCKYLKLKHGYSTNLFFQVQSIQVLKILPEKCADGSIMSLGECKKPIFDETD